MAGVKWFSHDWHMGQLSDTQTEEVQRDYAAHEQRLRPVVPAGVLDLLDLSVHDAQVQSVLLGEGQFTWRLLVGDLQRGYEFATLTYFDAEVVGGADDLAALDLSPEGAELLYDELDLVADGRFIHRVLVWPEGEVWIRFTDLRLELTPADPSDRYQGTGRGTGRRRPAEVVRSLLQSTFRRV